MFSNILCMPLSCNTGTLVPFLLSKGSTRHLLHQPEFSYRLPGLAVRRGGREEVQGHHSSEARVSVLLCVAVAFDDHQEVPLLPHQGLALVFTLEVPAIQLHHLGARQGEARAMTVCPANLWACVHSRVPWQGRGLE